MAGPFCDVLQPVVLGLEFLQFIVDAFEGVIRKVLAKRIHVPPRGIPAGSGFRMRMLRRRRGWWRDGSPETLRGGWSFVRWWTSGEEGGASGMMGSLDVLESATVGRTL